MQLAPAELHKINPKLIIVRISGWGQDGRYRHKPGFGTLIEGYSGFASMNGFGDREPVLPPMYLADAIAALYGYGAVMVALREVEMNGGKGQVMDLPLFDPLFSVLGPQAANHKLTGEVKERTGSRSTNAAPRNVYQTKDGHWVCLSASTQGMAERVLVKIGRPELVKDPKFATNIERVRNGLELDAIIGGFIAERDLATNLKFFDEAGVTIGPVYDISQIVQDDYVLEREALIEVPDEEMGELPTHPVVPRLSGTPGALRTRRAEDRRAQRGAVEAAAGRRRIRQALPVRRHLQREEEVTLSSSMRPAPPVWRSILYVPGNVPKFIDKAHERGADCILVDLEDSVTVAEKPTARAMLPETMKKVVRGGADVAVRINRPMRLAIPDIEAAVRPGLSALFITKTEGVQHLRLLDEAVSELERERGMPVGSVGFGAMIEHPRALAELNDIAERGPRVIAMMLGGEDFALETGSIPSDESLELPKRLVAFAAQAHGVAMIGILGTVADYSDPAAYKKSAERARRFGFSGGTCVHPGLVQALNEAFTPSADDVAYASKLIAADEKAAAEGRGSFTVDGKMIDIPVIDRARRLIARYDAIERRLKKA